MRWLIFLRAVNVGGTGKLAMAPLRAALTEAGASNVQSYIQSGNLALDLAETDPVAVEGWISTQIEALAGFRPGAVALEAAQLQATRDSLPFAKTDPKMTHMGLYRGAPAADALERLADYCTMGEELALGPHCLYLHTPNGIGKSKLSGKIESAMGLPITLRNLNTIDKMLSLA